MTGCLPAGRDEASSLEVTWPDGRVLVRAVASSETNSVLEVPYPRDTEKPPAPTLLEVRAHREWLGDRNGGLSSAALGLPHPSVCFSPNAVRAGILPARERTLRR